jgi:SAM-dependent MidA family methyltransferase
MRRPQGVDWWQGRCTIRAMTGEASAMSAVRNALKYGDLSFRDFVELALYHPGSGYYARGVNPVSKGGDYVSAPVLSPVFAFALARLVREFVSRCEAGVCSVVDIGCGDGSLIRTIASQLDKDRVRFFGVDRSLERIARVGDGDSVIFVSSLEDLPPSDCRLLLSNELFDAFPFARLVMRGEHLHELWVTENEGSLDWTEREAATIYDDYFAERGIRLTDGQFADVSLEWGAFYRDMMQSVDRGLIVTIDYGFPGQKLFHPRARRFGTAAAYSRQRVHRDLLAAPGDQDLTAHVNFTDLESEGRRLGAQTLYSDRLARFLLTLGITEHELFRPIDQVTIESSEQGLQLLEERENARRLVLPDGIGQEMQVLVQAKELSLEDWLFQRKLF